MLSGAGLVSPIKGAVSWAQRGPLHGCSWGSLLPRRKHSHQPSCVSPACLPSRSLHVGVALALHVRAGVGRMVLLLLLLQIRRVFQLSLLLTWISQLLKCTLQRVRTL